MRRTEPIGWGQFSLLVAGMLAVFLVAFQDAFADPVDAQPLRGLGGPARAAAAGHSLAKAGPAASGAQGTAPNHRLAQAREPVMRPGTMRATSWIAERTSEPVSLADKAVYEPKPLP